MGAAASPRGATSSTSTDPGNDSNVALALRWLSRLAWWARGERIRGGSNTGQTFDLASIAREEPTAAPPAAPLAAPSDAPADEEDGDAIRPDAAGGSRPAQPSVPPPVLPRDLKLRDLLSYSPDGKSAILKVAGGMSALLEDEREAHDLVEAAEMAGATAPAPGSFVVPEMTVDAGGERPDCVREGSSPLGSETPHEPQMYELLATPAPSDCLHSLVCDASLPAHLVG